MRLEILVLGLLMEGNLYGYDIKKKLIERAGEYIDIKFGSIYYAMKKALVNGWIKKIGTEKEGGNPERYIYQIQTEGRKYYKKLLKKYFEGIKIHFEIDIILMFLNTLDTEDRKEFIEDRQEFIKKRLSEMKDIIAEETKKKSANIPLWTYIDYHLKAELNWIKSLE